MAAYCRVSTAQEEQLNSYDVQVRYYTEKIRSEPKWAFVGIFADRGLSGTSTKKRDEFNKMIKMCRHGKIDMIITKSISRFARNTADVLKYVRMLKDVGVDIFFEEQNIHSNRVSSISLNNFIKPDFAQLTAEQPEDSEKSAELEKTARGLVSIKRGIRPELIELEEEGQDNASVKENKK